MSVSGFLRDLHLWFLLLLEADLFPHVLDTYSLASSGVSPPSLSSTLFCIFNFDFPARSFPIAFQALPPPSSVKQDIKNTVDPLLPSSYVTFPLFTENIANTSFAPFHHFLFGIQPITMWLLLSLLHWNCI